MRNKTRAEELQDLQKGRNPYVNGVSRSERYSTVSKMVPPKAGVKVAKSVSQYRYDQLEDEVEAGLYRENDSYFNNPINTDGSSIAGNVSFSSKKKALVKTAQDNFSTAPIGGSGAAGTSGYSFRGSGGTLQQMPEVYSPLWLNSNLNLPRDRATINAWSRSFFALNPIVHNAITLHSTYPIAKLNIKCNDPKLEIFYNEMAEEIDLISVCSQIAQEYWVLGEAFPYAELDDNTMKWSRIVIQNPDYIAVQRSVIAGEPVISLRPDEKLKRLIFSNRPADVQQRKQLDPKIIEHVKRNQNIPLNNFYVSHLARKISPYEIRGTGLIVSIFRQLMLFDKMRESKFAQADNLINPLLLVKVGSDEFRPTPTDLDKWREVFECYDEETEVLTNHGFKKFDEVIEYSEIMDGTYSAPYITNVKPINGFKVACFNSDTKELEYHEPTSAHVYNYDGEMYHFHNTKIDIKVTPNHDMWVSNRKYEYNGHRSLRKATWDDWQKVKAEDLKLTDYSKFRSDIIWKGNDIQDVDICGKKVPIELYLEFLGYLLSDGCLYTNEKLFSISLSQTYKKYQTDMSNCLNKFASIFGKKVYNYIKEEKDNRSKLWSGTIQCQNLYNHFMGQISDINYLAKSPNKCIPKWILELKPNLLNILLDALVKGDRSIRTSKSKQNGYSYYSTSKQLADDVYELIYKCGFVPTMFVRDRKEYFGKKLPIYVISWSKSNKGKQPMIYKYSTCPQTKKKIPNVTKEQYNGKVWCFTVPTGLFITRRNGKITIQGNSGQNNKDFKIFTHKDVTVETVGRGAGIYDISGDITQLIKEQYIGLMVPSVIMDGSDTTYATGSVSLDVLRQRYMAFRELLSLWLKRKIFTPIAKLNEFYKIEGGRKKLIIPEIDWNHMSLFDMSDYIQNLSNLSQGDATQKKISLQTLYRSLGLSYEDEYRKIRYEDIQDAIRAKELAALQQYSLNDLRALNIDDEIEEPEESAVPGEDPYVEATPGEEGPGGSGGGLLGLPPAPSGRPPSAPVGGGGRGPGRPPGVAPQPPGGGTGIGQGGIPKPPTPS